MHLLGVDVINRTGRDPMVQITSAQGAGGFDEQFGFDLRHSISPYLITVDIQKLGTATDVYIDGGVVNPTGWTRILNEQGDILAGSTAGYVETNTLDIEATLGHIGGNGGGTDANRVNVDLVMSTRIAEFPGDPTGTRQIALNALAGGDAYLSLQVLDRIVRTAVALTNRIDSVVAGRDVNLVLEDSMHQVGAQKAASIEVWVPKIPDRNTYTTHFTIPKTEPTPSTVYRDVAAYVATSGHTPVDSLFIFELRNAIQDRGDLVERFVLRDTDALPPTFTTTDAYAINLVRDPMPAETPGLVAGRHIWVDDVAGHSTSAGFAADSGSTTTIAVTAYTDLRDVVATGGFGTGWINVNVDGDVWVKEISGDMRIGLIRSRLGNVELTVPLGSMLDADPADCPGGNRASCAGTDPADVAGVNITLHALAGRIGTPDNFLEIDLVDDAATLGVLNADATNVNGDSGIYLDETGNLVDTVALSDLRVQYVVSGPAPAAASEVTLTTRAGSIFDRRSGLSANGVDLPNVEALRIHLGAAGGGIGEIANDFDINSSNAGANSGNFYSFADFSVYLTETDDELSVLAAKSRFGTVRLTVPDTASPRGPPTPAANDPLFDLQPEDLILLVNGTSLIDQSTRSSRHHPPIRPPRRGRGSGPRSTSRCGSATTSSPRPRPRSSPAE